MKTIRFNVNSGRYINEKGQYIKESFVMSTLDAYRQQTQLKVSQTLEDFHNSDDKNHDALLQTLAQQIKDDTVVEYIVGRGGIAQVTPDDISGLQQRLDDQLNTSFSANGQSYGLEDLISAFENGEISPQMTSYRVGQYVKAGRSAYFQGVDDRNESPYMQRELHGNDHCAECEQYAAAGVVPKGALPLPGDDCSCRSNCLCTVSYLSNAQFDKWQTQNLSSSVAVG